MDGGPGPLTVEELSSAIRIGHSDEELAQAARLLAVCGEMVRKHLGAAYAKTPQAIVSEACILVAGYLYDRPNAPAGAGYANVLRNSGAGALLLPYRGHSGVVIGHEP